MPAIVRRYQPGEIVGYVTIANIIHDHQSSMHRSYAVKTNCCGMALERSQDALRDAARKGRTLCERCSRKHRALAEGPRDKQPVKPGAVMGPVVVLGPGSGPNYRSVQWGCCGHLDELTINYLYKLKSKAKLTDYHGLCQRCAALRREQDRPEPAVEVPSPQYDAQGYARYLLPPGMISAAVAWPRPGMVGV